jgi:hypothetical protein
MSIKWSSLIEPKTDNSGERKSEYFDFPSINIVGVTPIKGKNKGIKQPDYFLRVSKRAFKAFYDSLEIASLDYHTMGQDVLANCVKGYLGLSGDEASRLINLAKSEGSKEDEDGLVSLFSYMEPHIIPTIINNSLNDTTKATVREFIKAMGRAGKASLLVSSSGGLEEVKAWMESELVKVMSNWNGNQENLSAFLNK